MSDLDALLERMVPGAGHHDLADQDAPDFPMDLGLEPLGLLGRGGTGWVFRARDPVLDRVVAVKVARDDAASREALLREARNTARLAHPAVLPVHRVVASGGRLWVEFRLAPARTLAALLTDWRADPELAWPVERRLGIAHGAASAVARAHGLGLLHADLHPGNVAVGADGEPYVLDWSGGEAARGQFTGTAGYAAPEQLRGEAVGPAADVFALGALAWELWTLRPLRPWKHQETPGAYVARWARAPVADLPEDADPEVARVLRQALAIEPDARLSSEALRDALASILDGRAEQSRRQAHARELVDEARAALIRFREGERRLGEEQRVVFVQRAKVPGHAPLADKRPIWEAERRVAELVSEQTEVWLDAAEAATQACALEPGEPEAHEVLAELWWERLRMAEAQGYASERRAALNRVREHDRGRYLPVLEAAAHLSLRTEAADARVEVARVEGERVREARVVDERAMPIERLALPPGSYLLTVRAPGYAPAVYPVVLGRLDHHRGAVRLYTEAQIGEGWCQVPAGPFRMGGDPKARNPLEPCVPWLDDRFVQRTCVRSADYLAFLRDLPAEQAARRVPGEMGIFGGHHEMWPQGPDGIALPEGWDPDWPVLGVSLDDAVAYARWLSDREGRIVRVPTEEEWEKAARGVDGRAYPWGDGFDPTFCHMRESRPGPPRPTRVGSYPTDRSVYGVLDMAGGLREWTSSTYANGQVVVRGGTWGDDADDCRCAGRAGLQPPFRISFVGFRLVSESPRP